MPPRSDFCIADLKRWLPLALLVIAAFFIWANGWFTYFTFDNIKAQRELLLTFTQDYFIVSALSYIVIYAGIVALSLPFATVMTLLGGFLFGFTFGTVIVVSAATIGATLIFLIAKSSFGAVLRQKAKGKYYTRTAAAFQENDLQYLLFLRLAPIFPFAVVNILPALFNMNTRRYIIATFFGIMPGTAVYVFTGQSLSKIDTISDLVSTHVIAALALLSSLALLPTIIKKYKGRKAAAND